MKAIEISAVWCPGCLIMRPIYNTILNELKITLTELDYDIDEEEVSKYNVGKILPVLIIFDENNNEIKRIIGEKKKEEIVKILKEVII